MFHFVVILFSEDFFVPFELFEEKEAPTFIEINQHFDFFKDGIQFLYDFFQREDLVWLKSKVSFFAFWVAGMVISVVFGVLIVIVVVVFFIVIVIVVLVLHASSI